MRLSDRGVELIADFEGFVGHPYNDPVGHCTIGFGHLIHRGNCTAADRAKWGTLSRAKGLELLGDDALRFEKAVNELVKVPMTEGEFDALVSFTYNNGEGALAGSTLLRKLNAGDRQGAADEFGRWVNAGGRRLEGLVRRRAMERARFLEGRPKPVANEDMLEAQRILNRFTSSGKWVSGVAPLVEDGVRGPATNKRVRDVKFWLGYGKDRDASTPELFLRRVEHPLDVGLSTRKMVAEGKRRRIAQRARVKAQKTLAAVAPGVTTYDGVPVAKWLVPYLRDARNNGWKGRLVSGWRSPAYSRRLCLQMCGKPQCPGRCAGVASAHSGSKFPRGAVDVSDYANFGAIQLRIRKAPNRLINALGPADPVHFSISGH